MPPKPPRDVDGELDELRPAVLVDECDPDGDVATYRVGVEEYDDPQPQNHGRDR